jgi:hypothetical protein
VTTELSEAPYFPNEIWERIIKNLEADPDTWYKVRMVDQRSRRYVEKYCYIPVTAIHVEADMLDPPRDKPHMTKLRIYYNKTAMYDQFVSHSHALFLVHTLWPQCKQLRGILIGGLFSDKQKKEGLCHYVPLHYNPFTQALLQLVDLEAKYPRNITFLSYLPRITPKPTDSGAPSFFNIKMYQAFAELLRKYSPNLRNLVVRDQGEWIEEWIPLLKNAQLDTLKAYLGPPVYTMMDKSKRTPLHLLFPVLHHKERKLKSLSLGFRPLENTLDWRNLEGFTELISKLSPVPSFCMDFPSDPFWIQTLWEELQHQQISSPFQLGLEQLTIGYDTHWETVPRELFSAFPNLVGIKGLHFNTNTPLSLVATLLNPQLRPGRLNCNLRCFTCKIDDPCFVNALENILHFKKVLDPQRIKIEVQLSTPDEPQTKLILTALGTVERIFTICIPASYPVTPRGDKKNPPPV